MSKYRIFQIIFGFIFVVSLLWLLLSFFPRQSSFPNGNESVDLTVVVPTGSIETVVPEQTITTVPSTPTPTSTAVEEETAVYVVAPGDTLNSIARKFDVTVVEIQRTNALPANPNLIEVGQELEIPDSSVNTPVPTVSNEQLASHLDDLEATVVAVVALADGRETAVSATSAALATQVSQLNSTIEAIATSVAEANPSEPQNEREDCTNSDKSFFEKAECWMGVYVVPLLGLVSSSFGLVGSIFAERKEKEKPKTAAERRNEEMEWELLKMEAELKQIELTKARRELEQGSDDQRSLGAGEQRGGFTPAPARPSTPTPPEEEQ